MNHHTSITLFSDSVKDDILKRIMNDHAPTSEEEYENILGDVAHEEIDEAVAYCYNDELMSLVKEFGFFEAVDIYCNTYGDFPALWKTGREKTYRVLLYTIVEEKGRPSWSDYNRYVLTQ